MCCVCVCVSERSHGMGGVRHIFQVYALAPVLATCPWGPGEVVHSLASTDVYSTFAWFCVASLTSVVSTNIGIAFVSPPQHLKCLQNNPFDLFQGCICSGSCVHTCISPLPIQHQVCYRSLHRFRAFHARRTDAPISRLLLPSPSNQSSHAHAQANR